MIKRIQKRFIAIMMISMVSVLAIIIAAINIANYREMVEGADNRISLLSVVDETFFIAGDFEEQKQEQRPFGQYFNQPQITAETPFDTRFFVVTVSEDGTIENADLSHIAAVNNIEAAKMAVELREQNKSEGFIKSYRYTSDISTDDGSVTYYFIDCQRELRSFRSFLIASVGFSLVGVIAVYILVLILSKIMIKPIQESYDKQKRFITDASHEIKTPLAIIDANTEVVEIENGESEWTRSTRRQIERLSGLTEKLVFLSRMDENDNRLEMSEMNLSKAIDETVESFASVAEMKGKKIVCNIEPDVMLKGNESTIRQMISLLVDNAIKYSNENGTISIELEKKGRNRNITLSNTVDEIQKGNLDFLFERFYRADESRNSKTGGHGIGLSVVKSIVLAHKGKISAKSEDGSSIKFQISL